MAATAIPRAATATSRDTASKAATTSSTATPLAGGTGGFGFGPFGFGYYSTSGGARQTYTTGQESPRTPAPAANYIRSGFYEEALNTLNGIAQNERTAQWHYYAALANQGLGNNIRARDEARTAVNMEPNNYAYQNPPDQLQNPGQSYAGSQQPYAQPSGNPGRFCLSFGLVDHVLPAAKLLLHRAAGRIFLLLIWREPYLYGVDAQHPPRTPIFVQCSSKQEA